MDVTKDNLKQFVERWNEHPNSPYVFEITSQVNSPSMIPTGGQSLSDSSQSLLGESPSPCGSLASSPGSDNAFISSSFDSNNDFLSPPLGEHLRRASDSTGVVKSSDTAERINLAEEIRKLSDKLFQLSNINTSLTNNQSFFESFPPKIPEEEKTTKEIKIFRSVPITITGTNGLPKDHPQNENCGIPWRRPKFKLNNMSRDVPVAMKNIHKGSTDQFTTKCNTTNNPTEAKDLLLQLLEHWDGPKAHPVRQNNRHGSISSEWTESDSLGQRTISSLNTFFQSRATNKKITPFHFNKS